DLRGHGTATAFTDLAANTCDIGMASRPITADERTKLGTPIEHVLALDGIAVIVHPNNKVAAFDRAVLHDVFAGKTTDWAAIGGTAGTIDVFARDDKSGTYDTFKHLVLEDTKLASTAKRFPDSSQLADSVAGDPRAIGFVGLAYVRSARAVPLGDGKAPPRLP